MDVFTLRDEVLDDYQGYIRSFLTVRDAKIATLVERELREGHLWPKPLLQINPAFESGDTLDELVADSTLHPECHRIFRDKPKPDVDRGPLGLYRHQVDGIRAGRAGDPFVVTTGTGSGKSLSYIVPIVDHVLRERQNNPERRIRAIVVYPMNALANSQKRALAAAVRVKFVEDEKPKPLGGVDHLTFVVPGEDQLEHDEVGQQDVGRVLEDLLALLGFLLTGVAGERDG